MIEVCPAGHETSPLIVFLFLQCLPKELRIMLVEDDVNDLRAIGLKADKLCSIHSHQQHGVVASFNSSFEPPATIFVAVSSSHFWQSGVAVAAVAANMARGVAREHLISGSGHSSSLNPVAAVYALPPSSLARLSAGLCFYHWSFGETAT
jgi:hypothetical protein